MRAEEVQGLIEAYSKVYETPEVLNEEVVEEEIEVLDEAPMTAFQAGGGEAKLRQLNKGRSPRSGRATAADVERQGQQNLFKAGGGSAAIAKGPTRSQNLRGGGTRQVPTLTRQDIINRGTVAAAKPAKPTGAAPTKPAPTPTTKPAAAPAATRPVASTAAAKPTPAGGSVPKPGGAKPPASSPTPAPKPTGSAMDQWAKANPRLAKAQEIRKSGGSRAEVNKVLYNKGTSAAENTPTVVKAGVDIFDLVKGHLLDEGYADSEEGAIVMMANMSEEWRKSILEAHGVQLDEIAPLVLGGAAALGAGMAIKKAHDSIKSGQTAAQKGTKVRPSGGPSLSGAAYGLQKHRQDTEAAMKMLRQSYEPEGEEIEEASYSAKAARAGKDIGKPGKMFSKIAKEAGERYGSEERGKKVAGAVLAKLRKEEVEEIEEAQRARENPEGHDKEEKRKYEPVRGERTPMPPRGDKRREEFEKWYAKHVR